MDLSPSMSKQVKWVFSHKHTKFSKFSPKVEKMPLCTMLEDQITSWGGENINAASLKITTILFQQMAKWQYNALLTL